MPTKTYFPWILAVATTVLPSWTANAAEREADAKAVRGRTEAFVEALAAGKAEAVAAFFTTQGEYVRDGGAIRGQKDLRAAYANFFKENERGVEVDVQSLEVRFPSQNTAIEEGRFLSKAGAPSRYSLLWAHEDGVWKIALLRESPDAPTLADLDWLVGSWEVKGEGATVQTTYRKTPGGAFLRMTYSVKAEGETSGGSQMIGLDPETGAIRSWLFNGDGGIGAGTWSRTATGWEIRSVGRTSAGESRTAVNVLTLVDDDSFTFQSTKRTIDGESLPDGEAIKVVRVPTKK